MKVFFDTEFTGLHQNTTLISIGVVKDTGDMFYAEFIDYDKDQIDDWLDENVIKNLTLQDRKHNVVSVSKGIPQETITLGDTPHIQRALETWLGEEPIEMWSDCLSYDWVLFNNIWGHAFDIPNNINYIPFDICTLFKVFNIDPDISREEFAGMLMGSQKHNALWDAKVIKACYEALLLGINNKPNINML